MKVHSYADPVIGAIRLTLEGNPIELDHLIREFGEGMRNIDSKMKVIRWAWFNHRSLILHEWAHIFQAATYPYLFIRAARAGREFVGIPVFLRANKDIYQLPLKMKMDERWSYSKLLSTTPVRLKIHTRHLEYEPILSNFRRGAITERDLIEEDATVFQYRAEISSAGNGAAYRNWLREKPSYSRLFGLLSEQFGGDVSLALIPILARVAFKTTRPLECLMQSIAILKADKSILPTEPADEHTEDALSIAIESRFGRLSDSVPDMMSPEFDDLRGFLPNDYFRSLTDRYSHLLVAPMAQSSISQSRTDEPFLVNVLRKPWTFFDRKDKDLPKNLAQYLPPIMTILPVHPEYRHDWTVIFFSPELDNVTIPDGMLPGGKTGTYLDLAKETLRARSVWKEILNGANGDNLRCPHTICHIHNTGLCHGWFPVPKTHRDCGFNEYFETTTLHQIASDGLKIEPLGNIKEAQNVEDTH
ncbi:MAG: hypothetical protein AB7L09_14940 [Nitrospira sp.]